MNDTILTFSRPPQNREALDRSILITMAIQDIISIMFHNEGSEPILGAASISLLISELQACLESIS